MSLYKNKYRVESTRLQEWDYTMPWWYYITINTKKHIEWFGKIKNGKMILNIIGQTVESELIRSKEIRKNIDLDYYIIT